MKRLFHAFFLPVVLLTLSAPSRAQTLWKSDFNTVSSPAWPDAKAVSSTPRNLSVSASLASVGTVDVANTTEPSKGWLLTTGKKAMGSVALVSGLLPIRSAETNLGKLTLSFQLSAPSVDPVAVRVESFDAKKQRTGGLTGFIYPAAPNFYQRYALDLSALKTDGNGAFSPTAPFVKFSFVLAGSDGERTSGTRELRLDNVNYAAPAYYVSPGGRDTLSGRTEQTAFATPQKALDVAQPGDIVVLMDGTYQGGNANVASFRRPGAPDAWIVLKNYPGHKPTLTSTGWNIVSIQQGSKTTPSTLPALAYLEVRGLHVRGEGDVAKTKYPDAMNKPDSRTNSNGIAVDGRYTDNIFHDIRIADNFVEFCPGQGVGSIDGDWITIENNVCQSNCWTTIYATSGISVMGSANFDGQVGVYKRLVRNNVACHNQTYEKWAAIDKYSDGNGIILDVNQGSDAHPKSNYTGRTLVQNNLCYDNGGSGIHTVTADRVDIIGNTAYLNSASVHLEYSQIYSYGSKDVRIANNILVAPVANVANGEKPEPVNRLGGKNTDVVFSHNLYFGGNITPTLGENDVVGDPKFVKPSRDTRVADFHLQTGSPAVGTGAVFLFAPFLDLDGKMRNWYVPTKGAYEK